MTFEFLVNVPLLLQNFYRFLYILMEILPFLRIIHKIFRADLSRHVIVADHMICRNAIFLHQCLGQLNGGLYGCVFKIPVSGIIGLTATVPDTHLNTDGIGIGTDSVIGAAFGVGILFPAAMPGNILVFHCLPDLTGKSNEIMGAGSPVLSCIVLTVSLSASSGSNIVNHDVFDTPDGSSSEIVGCQ